ncbi:MAG TPA: ribonuclease P protein component [Mogibacterium sp.]|nr:ribonuclease P protein component [Mogibacterium sp.]
MIDKKKLILRKQSDFNRIYRRGYSRGSKYIVILYMKNRLDYTRVAFVASKKVGNSVERNRACRLMRESFRFLKEDIYKGYDIIFVARKSIILSGKEEVQKSMRQSLVQCNLIEKKYRENERRRD